MDSGQSENQIQDVFTWIDSIPLSRPKKNIYRDFSDGVMAAEVVKHYFPHMVDLHNYVPASSTPLKISNWRVLNRKVFPRLNFLVPESTVNKIALNTAGVILPVLHCLQEKINIRLQTEHVEDLKYYETQNHQDAPADTRPTKAGGVAPGVEKKTKSESQRAANKKPVFNEQFTEKEQSVNVLDLQKTIEILQKKVRNLELLLQLKDQKIEDLLLQLEVYKEPKDSTS